MSAEAWDPAEAARALERKTADDLGRLKLPAPHECFRQIRIYLQRLTDTGRTTNGARLLSQRTLDNGDSQINAGPTTVKQHLPCGDCIQFRSGAQLSFGITLRSNGKASSLLAYRFYLKLPSGSGLGFVRIDLNGLSTDYNPLRMPRSHFHPGFEHIHLPFPVIEPLAVLDRIVHVIEPHFSH